MIQCAERDEALHFTVWVVPRAARSSVVGEHDGALRIRIAARPAEGTANEELVRVLAHALAVPVRDVEITRGHSSKVKQIRARGASRERLEDLVRETEL